MMQNDEKLSSPEGVIPADGTQENYLENGRGNNPELEAERLAQEKDAHDRENQLFEYAKKIIQRLFIFSCVLICCVVIFVSFFKASPWLISIGTITFIVPTFLLSCFLHHIYGRDNSKKALAEFWSKTPLKDIITGIKEIVSIWKGK